MGESFLPGLLSPGSIFLQLQYGVSDIRFTVYVNFGKNCLRIIKIKLFSLWEDLF
jgi:hypothetical protein